MNPVINSNCPGLPAELSKHIDNEFSKIQTHHSLGEWDDLLVDAGRFSEAILRYFEWKAGGSFTPIDGKSKPNRKVTVAMLQRTTTLPPSLRLQMIDIIELIMDFRNNRNAAHLGAIDPNEIDAVTVYRLVSWVMGEIMRLESNLSTESIQQAIDQLAQRPIRVVHHVNGRPIVLLTKINHQDIVLVLLYDSPVPIPIKTLFKWSQHSHITRWKATILRPLVINKMIHIEDDMVHLLPPGTARAEDTIRSNS